MAAEHVHDDLQEGFYVLSGVLDMVLEGRLSIAKRKTLVYVKHGASHELRAMTDVRVMTIGSESRI